MLFMTSQGGRTSIGKAKIAHQELFGRFVSPGKRGIGLDGWDNWIADNGAFTGFDQDVFMTCIKYLLPYKSACRFVTVPDVPFHWEPTLIKYRDWYPSIKRMGFPCGIAVQDGATVDNIPWCDIDGVFIGGSTEWKRQQWRTVGDELPLFSGNPVQVERPTEVQNIVNEARSRGLWVHVGRSANTPAQLWYAYKLGADSVDGTGETYVPDKSFRWISKTMWEIHSYAQGTPPST